MKSVVLGLICIIKGIGLVEANEVFLREWTLVGVRQTIIKDFAFYISLSLI